MNCPSNRVLNILICAVVLIAASGCLHGAKPGARGHATVRVLSFNIWVGGERGGQPLTQTAEVIRRTGADIVGMQEANGPEKDGVRPENGKKIAELLGWNYVSQGGGKAILSRFEIVGLTPGAQGAEIRLPSGESLHVFNVHLFHAPYQPYQYLGIPYEDAPFLKTAGELVAAAEAARGPELRIALEEIRPLLAAGRPVVLTGDFNEPSHLDWTGRAAAAGVVPLAVPYPNSLATVNAGLIDAYRAVHPGEVRHRGLTWTPTTREDDPADRHDRIDFVYVSPGLHVKRCEIIGESRAYADQVVTPYPSDHRAVLATLQLPR